MLLLTVFILALSNVEVAPVPDGVFVTDHQAWISAAASIPDWSWSDSEKWGKSYPDCDTGNQSPINIPADNVIKQCPKDKLETQNLDAQRSNIVLLNSYRGAILQLGGTDTPVVVSGGPLVKGQQFYVHDLFFFVGSDSTTGSLHTLQGKSFPMEIRVDMTTNPAGFKDATHSADLSFFVKVSERDNPAFEPIIQGLSHIKVGGSKAEVSIPSVASLLPPVSSWTSNYNSYVGSWVNPPCKHDVTRVIFGTTIELSERQIQAFRLLKDENGNPITNNIRRPLSPLNNRPVTYCE